jgi:hypothetical protein
LKSVGFRFNLEEKVKDETNGFSGVVTLCAIKGTANEPEKVYLVEGGGDARWVAENNLKEV